MLKSALSKSNALDSIRMYLLVAGKGPWEKGVKEAATTVDMGRRLILSSRMPFLEAYPFMGLAQGKSQSESQQFIDERRRQVLNKQREASGDPLIPAPPRGAYQRGERSEPPRSRRPAVEEGGAADASAPAAGGGRPVRGAAMASGLAGRSGQDAEEEEEQGEEEKHQAVEANDFDVEGDEVDPQGDWGGRTSGAAIDTLWGDMTEDNPYLDSFQAKHLKKMGADFVFTDEMGNVETAKQSLNRVQLWDYMCRSLKNSWAEPLVRGSTQSKIAKYDVAALFKAVMVEEDSRTLINVGTKAAQLFSYQLREKQTLWDYIAGLNERRQDLEDCGPEYAVSEPLMVSLVLVNAVTQPDLENQAIKLAEKYLPNSEATGSLTVEGVIEKLQRRQTAKDAIKGKGGGYQPRQRALITESSPRPCWGWQKGTCTKGDACDFAHIGKAGSKPTVAPSRAAGSTAKIVPRRGAQDRGAQFTGLCFACGKSGHRAVDCRAPSKEKSNFRAQVNQVHAEAKRVVANLVTTNPDQVSTRKVQANFVGGGDKPTYKSYADSGASSHITNTEEAFTSNKRQTSVTVEGFNSGSEQTSSLIGDINTSVVPHVDVLLVPGARTNLSSVGKFADDGLCSIFGPEGWALTDIPYEDLMEFVADRKRRPIYEGERERDGLYPLYWDKIRSHAKLAKWGPSGPIFTGSPNREKSDVPGTSIGKEIRNLTSLTALLAEAQKCIAIHAKCGIDENPEAMGVKEVTFSDKRRAEKGESRGQTDQAKSYEATEQGSATRLNTKVRGAQTGQTAASKSGGEDPRLSKQNAKNRL